MRNIIYVMALSMSPVLELRAGIPAGFVLGLDPVTCFIVAVVGNLLPIPFVILFGHKILHYFAKYEKFGKPFRWIINLGESKVKQMNHRVLFWGLLAFIAIPLPGTGAWTGALISITLNLNLRQSMPPIIVGVIIAASIVLLLTFSVFELIF